MIGVRRARPVDAAAIGAVHVAAWRNAYAGLLPDGYLAGLSAERHAVGYDAAIRRGTGVFVAVASGSDLSGSARSGAASDVVGFATVGRARAPLADGEVETLYVLDDWRDRGIGRRLMRAGASYLLAEGCRTAFLWVLRDNPNRWFYERLGGRMVAQSVTRVASTDLRQVAYAWDPIERLLAASPTRT